ncbi:hypothetical protein NPIL_59171 [Nephila pilipes]|uniref:Uncharacterized protein n=1 Tax=Nephila pilipes TaxID=299642 RepID=A0A8X6PXV8_NEPPI|nr:hypothetical protein NPIL_59171 [Nephila pilipes]
MFHCLSISQLSTQSYALCVRSCAAAEVDFSKTASKISLFVSPLLCMRREASENIKKVVVHSSSDGESELNNVMTTATDMRQVGETVTDISFVNWRVRLKKRSLTYSSEFKPE